MLIYGGTLFGGDAEPRKAGGAVAAPLTVASKAIGMTMTAASRAAIAPRDLLCWDAFMVSTFFHSLPL